MLLLNKEDDVTLFTWLLLDLSTASSSGLKELGGSAELEPSGPESMSGRFIFLSTSSHFCRVASGIRFSGLERISRSFFIF